MAHALAHALALGMAPLRHHQRVFRRPSFKAAHKWHQAWRLLVPENSFWHNAIESPQSL